MPSGLSPPVEYLQFVHSSQAVEKRFVHSFVGRSIKSKEPKLSLDWRRGQEEQSSSAGWSQKLAVLFTFLSTDGAGELGNRKGYIQTMERWQPGFCLACRKLGRTLLCLTPTV